MHPLESSLRRSLQATLFFRGHAHFSSSPHTPSFLISSLPAPIRCANVCVCVCALSIERRGVILGGWKTKFERKCSHTHTHGWSVQCAYFSRIRFFFALLHSSLSAIFFPPYLAYSRVPDIGSSNARTTSTATLSWLGTQQQQQPLKKKHERNFRTFASTLR